MNATRTIRRTLTLQLIVTLAVACLVMFWSEPKAAYSALLGGAINIIVTLFFARRVFSVKPGGSARSMARALYIGEVLKILLTVVLFSVVLLGFDVVFAPLFLTYAATMLAFWLALLFAL